MLSCLIFVVEKWREIEPNKTSIVVVKYWEIVIAYPKKFSVEIFMNKDGG